MFFLRPEKRKRCIWTFYGSVHEPTAQFFRHKQTNSISNSYGWFLFFFFVYIWVCIKYDSIGVFYEFIKLVCRCLLSLCYFGLSPALEKAGEIEIVKLLFCWIFYSPPRKYEYPSNSQSSVEYLKAAAWRLYSRNRNLIRNKAVPAGNQHSRVI